MSDETRHRSGTNPYTVLLATIGIGFGLALVILTIGLAASWNDSQPAPGPLGEAAADSHGEFDFGEPADAAAADRMVEMEMLDSLAFDPASVEVAHGETVTFRVTNTGKLVHDFTLGDEVTQEAHTAEMVDMAPMDEMGGQGDPNAMTVESGETKELTWSFTEPGELLIAYQIPGHADAGMVADVVVT